MEQFLPSGHEANVSPGTRWTLAFRREPADTAHPVPRPRRPVRNTRLTSGGPADSDRTDVIAACCQTARSHSTPSSLWPGSLEFHQSLRIRQPRYVTHIAWQLFATLDQTAGLPTQMAPPVDVLVVGLRFHGDEQIPQHPPDLARLRRAPYGGDVRGRAPQLRWRARRGVDHRAQTHGQLGAPRIEAGATAAVVPTTGSLHARCMWTVAARASQQPTEQELSTVESERRG